MLEEKNDNLLNADGNLENNSIELLQSEVETILETEAAITSTADLAIENEETVLEPNTVAENTAPIVEASAVSDEIRATTANETLGTATIVTESAAIPDITISQTETIIEAIVGSNAEESEDETLKERHDIPMLDYDSPVSYTHLTLPTKP
jgi:hypothetical protein